VLRQRRQLARARMDAEGLEGARRKTCAPYSSISSVESRTGPGTWSWSVCCLRAEREVLGSVQGGLVRRSRQILAWVPAIPQDSAGSAAETAKMHARNAAAAWRVWVLCAWCCDTDSEGAWAVGLCFLSASGLRDLSKPTAAFAHRPTACNPVADWRRSCSVGAGCSEHVHVIAAKSRQYYFALAVLQTGRRVREQMGPSTQ
jgi:hypothetical protein